MFLALADVSLRRLESAWTEWRLTVIRTACRMSVPTPPSEHDGRTATTLFLV
jgi:hypothetical protein